MIPYFIFGIPFATRTMYQNLELSTITLRNLTLFNNFFLLFLNKDKFRKGKLQLKNKFPLIKNSLIYYICLLIIIFMTFLVARGPNIFQGIYNQDVATVRYGFIDYSLFFAMIAYFFTKDKKKEYILFFVLILYMLTNLLYGYRLRMLQMSILIFIFYLKDNLKSKYILIASVLGFTLMKFFGMLRTHKPINFLNFIGLNSDGVLVTNQGGVFLTSNMFVGLLKDGYIDLIIRGKTFLGNFISFIIPPNYSIPAEFHLDNFARQFFSIPGGGFISAYLYVWFGLLGIIMGAYIISRIILISYNKSGLMKIYSLLAIITFPRWYAYSPINFFKMGIWALIIYFISYTFSIITLKIRRNRR